MKKINNDKVVISLSNRKKVSLKQKFITYNKNKIDNNDGIVANFSWDKPIGKEIW